METYVQQISIWVVPILAAVVLHEFAHGFVAYRLGDSTAARAGRLTLNPLPHIDPLGTIALPLFLVVVGSPFVFGYAKPVPVNFARLRNPKRDMIWVALAGPAMNIAIATVCALALRAIVGWELAAEGGLTTLLVAVLPPIALMLQASVLINVVLAVFNMLPILPLDGGRVLTGLLPLQQAVAYSRLEPYGMLIVIVLLATNVLGEFMGPVVYSLLRVLL